MVTLRVSGATIVDCALTGSNERRLPFSTTKISGRWTRAAEKKNTESEMSPIIAKGVQCPTEDGDRTWAPAEEHLGVPSKRILRGARRRGLAEAAPVPKADADGDASGARPNWATVAASPGKTI